MVRDLSLGNGSLLVNLDGSLRVRDLYFPFAGQENHILGKEQKIGVQGEGFSWLNEWNTDPGYEDDTILGSSAALNEIEDLKMEFNDTVDCEKNVFLREIKVENLRDEERTVEIFFLQDYDIKGTGMADTCFYHPDHSGVIHYDKDRYLMAEIKKEDGKCGDLNQYGIYSSDPSNDVERSELNHNSIAQGDVRSAISIEIELEPESSEKFHYWINTGKDLDDVLELNREVEENIEDFLERTRMCWRGFSGGLEEKFENLDDSEIKLLKRSALIIRGQTNDNGAITAANDSSNLEFNQDKYGYMWPRDGALVAESMAKAGYTELVDPFFDFAEKQIRPEGYFLHKYNPDGTLGSSWHSWINEEGEKRLPIQEDETALVIRAIHQYYKETGNEEILEEKWSSLIKPAADFMVEYFDRDLGLPKPSYDLWEEKHYISTFTVAAVYSGLKSASEIAEELGKKPGEYEEVAETIREKGLEELRSEETKRYVRGLEDGEQLDEVSAPLYYLYKFGLVDGEDDYFTNTMNAIMHDLSPDTEIGGIARYKGDYYHNVTENFEKVPGNPWIICTLWAAQYLLEEASSKEDIQEAEGYIEWVEENSLDTGVMPEQVDPYTGEGKSVAPLTWSHSEYIETMIKIEDMRDRKYAE
jgi:GH15 family glucan-1,4-alpha-glucosidase